MVTLMCWLQGTTSPSEKLTDEMFCQFSPPDQLHSDQGRQFESHLMKEICKLLHIKKTKTTPYHPQCDGMVERFNCTLLDMLATTTREHALDWEHQIRKVCMAYNTSIHSSTGFTPFYLMFGRQAKLPIDLMYGSPVAVTQELPVSDYAILLKKSLEDAYSVTREKLGVSHTRRKEQHYKRVHGKPFEPEDLVWLHSTVIPPGHSRKLFDRLKLCAPGTRFLTAVDTESDMENFQPSVLSNLSGSHEFGGDMEIVNTDVDPPPNPDPASHRYSRRPPERLDPVVNH